MPVSGASQQVIGPTKPVSDEARIPTVPVTPRDPSERPLVEATIAAPLEPATTPLRNADGTAEPHAPAQPELTTGWLVCVKGPLKGRSFCLRSGNNFIGRSAKSQVCLNGDMQVSNEKHLNITYDPRSNQYFITPGSSINIVYLNKEPLLEHKILTAYDTIEVGQEILKFVPFCGPDFRW